MDLFLERTSFKYFTYAGISLRASVKGIVTCKLLSIFTKFLNLESEGSFFFLGGNGREVVLGTPVTSGSSSGTSGKRVDLAVEPCRQGKEWICVT